MDRKRSFGSGGVLSVILTFRKYCPGPTLTGWFVTDFLGIKGGSLDEVPSGINVVPLTIANRWTEEEAALVAGFTGFTVKEKEFTEGNVTYPSIQPVLGWGLFMDPNTKFN